MGNSASKSVPKIKSVTKAAATLDESFGRQIMQNIRLKESPLVISTHGPTSNSTGLKKRIDLNKQTEGTVYWNELPSIFAEDYSKLKIDKTRMDEIRNNFSFPTPTDKQQSIKK